MAAHAFDLMTLLDAPGVGPARVRKLLKRWASAPDSPLLESHVLREALTASQVATLPASRERVKRHWEELEKQNVQVLAVGDPRYPDTLRQALGDNSPVLLLCKGNLELFRKISVGFYGSREASEKGLRTAWDSARLLVNEGINIVSGFAGGVDMNAHCAALASGGTTTGVLAEGILRFRVKRELRSHWDESRTLVVSEFGPNLPWSVTHAMQRNRTICGLSRAMVLIEARTTGGSIQAGRDCLRLGLPLFAAVYEGTPEAATGNEELLTKGARRLMKSRSKDCPNIRPILDAIGDSGAGKDSSERDCLMPRRNPESPWNPGSPVEVTPAEYERQVLRWIKSFDSSLENFTTKHLEKRAGEGGEYELDISAEFTAFGGSRFLVLVECKRYKRPVERERVLAFHAKMQDVKANKGIMFSTSGFQRGALEYASAYGIATVSFFDGKALYETMAAGQTPEPPPWVQLPRFAGYFMDIRDGGIHSHLVEDGRPDAIGEWMRGEGS